MSTSTLAVVGATDPSGRSVGLVAEDGRITEFGPGATPPEGAEILDGSGMLITPPLVNGHTHAAMTLFRGRGDDLPLMRWLKEAIWPVEKNLTPDDIYWGARLACIEMARNGVSTFWDMYWQEPEVARAVEDAGLRATVGPVVIDPPGGTGPSTGWLEDLDRCASFGPRISVAVAPHAIYTVGSESLERVAGIARERDLPIHIHLSETAKEVEDCVAEHGVRPTRYLDDLGLIGPKTLLAHAVWLDREELELVAERGATVVTNPVANQKLTVGRPFPWSEARRAGVAVGLGTDGPASNNSLDPLGDLKVFALLQRAASADAAVIPVEEAWRIATGRASALLGPADPLAPGMPADFILVDLSQPEMATGDPVSNLVYAATGSAVHTLVVAGEVVSRGGRVEGEEEVVARAAEAARRLTA